jgi:hypothetical protein
VLAEDFYGPKYLRMRKAYDAGDIAEALGEQNWKLSVEAVFTTCVRACVRACVRG